MQQLAVISPFLLQFLRFCCNFSVFAAKMPLPVKMQLSEPANASPDDQPQQEEAKPVLIDDTEILMKVYNEFKGEIWANVGAVDFVAMMQTGDLKLEILTKQKSKMRKILGGIRMAIPSKDAANQWCENVMKSTGIDAKRATSNVSEEEILSSSGMKDFGRRLSRIFATKAK